MFTLDEVKDKAAERADAIIWHQKWSPYALNLVEAEYYALVEAYGFQEHLSIAEVEALLPPAPEPTPDLTH